MGIIEQATKRLEELQRAGVAVPWAVSGLAQPADADSQPANDSSLPPSNRPVAGAAVRAAPRHAASTGEPQSSSDRLWFSPSLVLDLERLGGDGFLVPAQVRSELAQQFRGIKAPLLKNARASADSGGSVGSLIMITSAVPGEGKTFCAINLAMSMAMEVDTAVILVDADVVRPSVLSCLGLAGPNFGLLDLLTNPNLNLSDLLVTTNIPKLSILPAGTPNARSTELLGSVSMERLLGEFASDYADCIVIFDAPPVLLTTEASALAARVGQVVVVVEAWRTSHQAVSRAFAAVENCPLVMSILNKCPSTAQHGHYGYGYE